MNNQPTTASFALVTKNAFAINNWERTHHRFLVCVVVTIDILRRVPIGPLDAIMGGIVDGRLDLDVAVTISNYGAVIGTILSYHIRCLDRHNLDTADGCMWHDCVRWHLRGICRSGAFEIRASANVRFRTDMYQRIYVELTDECDEAPSAAL